MYVGTSSSPQSSLAKAAVEEDRDWLGTLVRRWVPPSSKGDKSDFIAAMGITSYCTSVPLDGIVRLLIYRKWHESIGNLSWRRPLGIPVRPRGYAQ